MRKALRWPTRLFLFGILTLMAAPVSFAASFTVNSTSDAVDAAPGDGICATAGGVCTLRAAIQEANATPAIADTIILPPGTYLLTIPGAGEDAAATGDLDITGPTTITGGGKAITVIDGNGLVTGDRVFQLLAGATVTISGVTIRNGRTTATGGGILTGGGTTLTLHNVAVTGNAATLEGGGIDNSGTLTLTRVAITNNTAPGGGGGLNNGAGSTVTANRVTVSGNSNRGINNSGALVLSNVTISGNSATGDGGGINNSAGGTVTMTNVTINGNTAGASGGGIRSLGVTSFTNTIVANNLAPVNANCNIGTTSSNNHNISSDATCFTTGLGDRINTNPIVGPLASDGSSLQTHALLAGSPALDTADAPTCPATDERGFIRPRDGNADGLAICDVGAYELCAPAFADVPPGAFAANFITALFCHAITGGCSTVPFNFCPDLNTTRGQMAVFIETALGVAAPPPCAGTVFGDVTAATVGPAFCGFIEDFFARGITAGCGGGNYCPNSPVSRAEMAVFIERALGVAPPPACKGTVFTDVTSTSVGPIFCGYIEDFFTRGITGGCGGGLFCPNNSVTRAQMAVFIETAFMQ